MHRLLALACVCCWLSALTAVELHRLTPAHSPRQGELVTWQLHLAAKQWFHADVTRTPFLRITEADGRTVTRPAWINQDFRSTPHLGDGHLQPHAQPTLRIRHTFRAEGLARWELYLGGADPRAADPLLTGQVLIHQATTTHGKIHIAPWNQRLLARDDGSIFIPIGSNIAWGVGRDPLATFITHVDHLADNGGNHLRLWASSWFGQMEGTTNDQWHYNHAWMLDQALDHCRQRGVAVTLVIDNHHDFFEGKHQHYGTELEKRVENFFNAELHSAYEKRLRYLLARHGADDTIMAWELFNEIDLSGAPRWRIALWVDAAAKFIATNDPDGRLRTVSVAKTNDWIEVLANPRLDIAQVHEYIPYLTDADASHHDGIQLLLKHLERLNGYKRPFRFSEVGHQGTNEDNPGNDRDPTGFLLRQQAWAGFLSGGYGTGMGWWWDTYIEPKELWKVYRPIADSLQRINWRDPALTPVVIGQQNPLRVIGWQSPRQALLWPHLRADNWWNTTVGKREQPQLDRTIGLALNQLAPSTTFSITGLDMVHGTIRFQQTTTSDNTGRAVIALPQQINDLILIVRDIAQ